MEGIRKLIELLNEYENDIRREKTLRGMTNGCLYYIQSINSYLNLKIISKEYGFIEWLVDNDKIEFNNDKMMIPYNEEYKLYVVSYEHLLMLLAIQNEPIDFLCSLLK